MNRLLFLVIFFVSMPVVAQNYIDFYFKSKGVDGSILIYNETKNSWIFNNESDLTHPTPPGTTFNIINSLIALDLEKITHSSDDFLPWDRIKRYYFGLPMKSWNCDTNLDEALYYRNDWFFERVSKTITDKDYFFFLNQLKYSNRKINRKIPDFWNYGGLAVTPRQQIDLLQKLYHKELRFHKEHQQYVLDQMLVNKNEKITLYGYNAYTVYKGQAVDWWIGIIVTKEDTYYFSTRIYKSIEDLYLKEFQTLKYTITSEVLNVLGIM